MKTKHLYTLLLLFLIIIFTIFFFVNKKETVAIIGAMDVEIEEVASNMTCVKQKQLNDFKIITGKIGKYRIILSKSGIGKVNSAITTQFIIDKYKPKYIINIGIAGGLSPNIKSGDTIIGKKMVQHDFDITAFGKPKGYIDNKMEPNKPTLFYSDKTLINKFSKEKSLINGFIASGDIFVSDKKTKIDIKNEFGVDAIDMESAAIAQTAKRNNIPFIVLRTISDGLNETAKEYKQNKQSSANKPSLMVVKILKSDK